eukprot:UN05416
MKIFFFNNKNCCQITKTRSLLAKHDHFVLHDFFSKSVASNEAQKNHKICNDKNNKITNTRSFLYMYFEPPKSCCSEVSRKTRTFKNF